MLCEGVLTSLDAHNHPRKQKFLPFVLQMGKLRHREQIQLPNVSWAWNWAVGLQSPFS